MLYMFGFERVGVVAGDLYFVDPEPLKGQEGAEHGVRLELRLLERGEAKESVYAAMPIAVGQPAWRADFLEAADGGRPFDRTHYHPVFSGWRPSRRVFIRELSADPMGWLEGRLSDLDGLLAEARLPAGTAGTGDAAEFRRAAPEIAAVIRGLLDRVRAGELGNAPQPYQPIAVGGRQILARSGWL